MSQTSASTATVARSDPALQAFVILRLGFIAAPILFGVDKFLDLMVDWSTYLWPGVVSVLPVGADALMLVVGVIEIAAGVLVAVLPRIGGLVVAAWLTGIILNLLLLGDHYDIALRDFGLLLGALALSRLATAFPGAGLLGDARS